MGKKQDNKKIEELETRISDLEAQLKRAVADYHNLEKRVADGRSELTRWGTGELLIKILPVLDHLEQAMSGVSGSASQDGWIRGVELAVKELNSVLQLEGLEQIGTDGQFDPNLHEAVDTKGGENNKILEVVRKGYTLNGRVLRPAQVVVGKSESGIMNQESREEENKNEVS